MANLKAWLNKGQFDWTMGIILVQRKDPAGSWSDDLLPAIQISLDNPILTQEFDSGYGSPECPAIWAKDKDAIYFPSQYDGSTCLVKVFLDPAPYLAGEPTPYPGGS